MYAVLLIVFVMWSVLKQLWLPEKLYNEAKSKLQEQEAEISTLRTQQVRNILSREGFAKIDASIN